MSSKLYQTKRWKATRERILLRDLFVCQMPGCGCGLTTGRTHSRAAVVDHLTSHHGDPDLFWCPDEGLQSICKRCHDRTKQVIEKRGYSDQIGADGFPVDRRHPWWAGDINRWGYSIPHGLEPSGVPVVLVCGAPASGKSTYVTQHAKRGDTVVDLDAIKIQLGGVKWDQDAAINRRAFAYRDKLLRDLKHKRKGLCWLVVMVPTGAERDAWARALGNVAIHIMDTPRAACVERVKADPERHPHATLMLHEIGLWFKAFAGATSGLNGAGS